MAGPNAGQEKASRQLGERAHDYAETSEVLREYVAEAPERDMVAEAAQMEEGTAEWLGTQTVAGLEEPMREGE